MTGNLKRVVKINSMAKKALSSEREEIWVDIKNFEGCYMVSNLGNVKTLKRKVAAGRSGKGFRILKEKNLSQSNDKDGYKLVSLSLNSIVSSEKVHRLVAFAFLDKIDGKDYVNHIDGNKSNNNAENLEWVTSLENHRHASKNLLKQHGENHYHAKLKEIEVYLIKVELALGANIKELSKRFKVGIRTIEKIKYNATWKHVRI